ncbi:sensor histidine kinase [Chitinimonas naiadis]
MSRLRRSFTTAVFVALGVCFSATFLVVSELANRRLTSAAEQFGLSIEAKGLLREVSAVVTDAEAAQRGYYLTGQTEYLAAWRIAPERIKGLFARLHEIWEHEPEQLQQLILLRSSVDKRMQGLEASFKAAKPQDRNSVRNSLGREQTEQLKREIDLAIGRTSRLYQDDMRQWKSDVMVTRLGVGILTTVNLLLLLLLYTRSQRELRSDSQEMRTAEARQHELERLVEERTAVLSELSSDLQNEQEREKAKIAHDIHDELGSLVISARMDVTYVLYKIRETDPQLAEKLENAIQNLDASVDIKRRIIEELRPSALDTLGLVPALEWQVQQVCERANLVPILELSDALPDLPEQVAITLFRVTQESLNNIVKYAKASQVWVNLHVVGDHCQLTIKDDGIGLTDTAITSPLSHGLSGMRQRAVSLRGSFRIISTPGEGTAIQVRLPLGSPDTASS